MDGVRMFSNEDIIAMKVQAILGSGRKKDFWDVAELLKHFSISDFIKFHKEKYATQTYLSQYHKPLPILPMPKKANTLSV